MNKITVRIANILAAAMLLLYSVCILCSFLLQLLAQTLYSFPSGVMLTLTVMLPTVVLLINAIIQAKKGAGKYEVVRQGMMLLLCVVWLVLTVVYWLYSLSYYTALMSGPFTTAIVNTFSTVTTIYNVVIGLTMLFLLISYGLGVMRSQNKWLQIKSELHKLAAPLIVLVINTLTLIYTVIMTLVRNSSVEMISGISGAFNALQVFTPFLLGILCAAVMLTFGLIIKKQRAEKPQDQQTDPTRQPAAEQPFDLPAGVSADDL